MSYRFLRDLGAVVLLLVFFTISASVEARGYSYTSQQHRASFASPDGSWELRENPAHQYGAAMFSNGGGSVIALMLHQTVHPSDVITSVGDLAKRWPNLANRIAAMANSGESGFNVTDSHYDAKDTGIEFEIFYTSTLPSNSVGLTNWLQGLIVRDNENYQHIYVIRCAAADGVFSAWESQFELIMPTLSFAGQPVNPVYTSAPLSRWWYGGGVCALLILFMFLNRGSGQPEEYVSRRGPASMPNTNPSADQQPPAMAGVPPLMPAQLSEPGPVPIAGSSEDAAAELMNVPDSFYAQNLQDSGFEHPEVAPGGEPNGEPTTGGFWKCTCGRINAGVESYCARCNADKPSA